MANVGNKGIVRYEEAFATNNICSASVTIDIGSALPIIGVGWAHQWDTGDTNFARAVSATKGMHVAGSLAATDDNCMEFCGDQLMFYGQTGFNAVEVLMQVDKGSSFAFNFGLCDEVTESGGSLSVSLSTATWDSTATTYIGIVKDFDATNDELHCFWVDDGVDTTESLADLRMKGMSMVADKWLWMRVEMQDCGSGKPLRATFHAAQDGKHVTKEFTTNVDRDNAFGWNLQVMNRAAIARGVYIKLPAWEQSIAD